LNAPPAKRVLVLYSHEQLLPTGAAHRRFEAVA